MAYRGRAKDKKPETVEQGVALVRAYAIGLFDKGDGRAVDWPVVAQVLFKAAFEAVGELPSDDCMRSVLRRVEGGLYDRLAGNRDDGLPSPVAPVRVDGAAIQPGREPRPKLTP